MDRDEQDLLPGQEWELAIRDAVRASDYVLVCLSATATTRAGYLHRELKHALDIADEQPPGSIFIIPVRLAKCEIPERLRHLQGVDLFRQGGYARLIHALGGRSDQGQSPMVLANPAAGPIPVTARNHVLRADYQREVETRLESPGLHAVAGRALSGVSTAMAYLGQRLRENNIDLVAIDAASDLSPDRVRLSKTGVLGALMAAVVMSSEPLEQDYYAVQRLVQDRLHATPRVAILIDNVDILDFPAGEASRELRAILRDWQTRRAHGQEGFATTSVVLGSTSRTPSIAVSQRKRTGGSELMLDAVVVEAFTRGEVAHLARVLGDCVEQSGHAGDERWAQATATAASRYFGGQPHLTHLYLWEQAHSARAPTDDILDSDNRPTGAYRTHLRQLAQNTIELIGPESARRVATSMREGRDIVEELGTDETWSNAYYVAHLPRALEQALA